MPAADDYARALEYANACNVNLNRRPPLPSSRVPAGNFLHPNPGEEMPGAVVYSTW